MYCIYTLQANPKPDLPNPVQPYHKPLAALFVHCPHRASQGWLIQNLGRFFTDRHKHLQIRLGIFPQAAASRCGWMDGKGMGKLFCKLYSKVFLVDGTQM